MLNFLSEAQYLSHIQYHVLRERKRQTEDLAKMFVIITCMVSNTLHINFQFKYERRSIEKGFTNSWECDCTTYFRENKDTTTTAIYQKTTKKASPNI